MGKTLAGEKKKLRDAEKAFERFLMDRWPEGSEIHWTKREHIQVGEVIGHSGESVRVTNYSTNKTYWVDSYWIVDKPERPHAR